MYMYVVSSVKWATNNFIKCIAAVTTGSKIVACQQNFTGLESVFFLRNNILHSCGVYTCRLSKVDIDKPCVHVCTL